MTPIYNPRSQEGKSENPKSEVSLGYTVEPSFKINEIILNMPGTVVHAYNLSYLGGLSKKTMSLRSV